jgi:hypothetical protein
MARIMLSYSLPAKQPAATTFKKSGKKQLSISKDSYRILEAMCDIFFGIFATKAICTHSINNY